MIKFLCWLLGHDYFFIKKLSIDSEMVGCERCKCKFGMHHGIQLIVSYDKDMDDMYALINPWHKKEFK